MNCGHVETFPIGYGTERCLHCGVALSVSWAEPYERTVIYEGDRSASWDEAAAAIRGDGLTLAGKSPRPWWLRATLWVSGHFGRS